MLFSLLFAVAASAAIFGNNDIIPAEQATPVVRAASASVAFMIPKSNVSPVKDGKRDLVRFNTAGSAWGLCPGEPLGSEFLPALGCSGFLVAEDQIMTAGHCVLPKPGKAAAERTSLCENFLWYFGHLTEGGKLRTREIPAEQFVECKEVIQAEYDVQAAFKPGTKELDPNSVRLGNDLALVRLAGKVTRPVLPLARSLPQAGEELSALGFPFYTPMKASRGQVMAIEGPYYRANIDALEGYSGGPALNAGGEVTGVIVRTVPTESLIMKTEGKACRVLNRCDEAGEACSADQKKLLPGTHVQKLVDDLLPRPVL